MLMSRAIMSSGFAWALAAGAASAVETPDAMDAQAASELFLEEFGAEGLRVDFDFNTGYASEIYGRAIDLGWNPQTDEDFEEAVRSLVDLYAPMFGYDSSVLELDKVVRLDNLERIGTTNKVAVGFRQVVDGMDVEGGHISVIFSWEGAVLAISNRGIPGVGEIDLMPSIGDGQAIERAEQEFGRDVLEILSLDILIVRDEQGLPRVAWNVELKAIEREEGLPVQILYSVDAETGDIIRAVSTIHTFTDLKGRVNAWVSPGTDPDQGGNEVKVFLHRAHADSSQGSDDSNAGGFFKIPYGGGPNVDVTVDFDSDSPQAYITNVQGSELSKTKSLPPGQRKKFIFNKNDVQKNTAQLNAHVWAVAIDQWVRDIMPSDNTLNFRHRMEVMENSTCNAFFDGNSTHYYAAGGGCVNTAYSTVVAHEIGHHANVLYNSGNSSDGFGEGNADNFSVHLTDDPIVGKNFCGNGCHVRDARNTRQYCNNRCGSSCYGGYHSDGEVLMGAMYKVRVRLNNAYGDAAGDLISDTLFIDWMNAYNDGNICENIRTHYLVLDDDNGNLNDGTPNSDHIDNGFNEQGFPKYY